MMFDEPTSQQLSALADARAELGPETVVLLEEREPGHIGGPQARMRAEWHRSGRDEAREWEPDGQQAAAPSERPFLPVPVL